MPYPQGCARAFVLCLTLVGGPVVAADVHVMISAGFFGAYAELAPAFERATGHHLVTTRGPSVGDSPESIPTRLARGETADVVILDDTSAVELGRRGPVRPDTKVEFARSQIGMVAREGTPTPDISSVNGFRDVLLAATSVAVSDSTSGACLTQTLFSRLGIAEQMASKSRKVRGPPSGEPVAALVARGEAQIGFQQVSELLHVPGVTLVGLIPTELQPRVGYSGVVAVTAKEMDAALALIRFIASPAAAATIANAGLAPVVAP